jgi:hypothetical protein
VPATDRNGNGDGDFGDHEDDDYSSNDPAGEEIAHDPFFQRYSFPQENDEDDDDNNYDDVAPQALKDEAHDVDPLSPTGTYSAPRSERSEPGPEPVGSPLSPGSDRAVRGAIESQLMEFMC